MSRIKKKISREGRQHRTTHRLHFFFLDKFSGDFSGSESSDSEISAESESIMSAVTLVQSASVSEKFPEGAASNSTIKGAEVSEEVSAGIIYNGKKLNNNIRALRLIVSITSNSSRLYVKSRIQISHCESQSHLD